MHGIESLTEILNKLPGIGPRQARRLAYWLATENRGVSDQLIRQLSDLREIRRTCRTCYTLFFDQDDQCRICRDPDRDPSLLMIVESDLDKESIERMKIFHGLYFVLGGSASVTDPELKAPLRVRELSSRLHTDPVIQEVILGFNFTPQGEHTGDLVRKLIEDLGWPGSPPSITTLGRGLSTGTELEYSDPDTFGYAFRNRA